MARPGPERACPTEDEIAAFLEGTLSSADAVELERHVDGCSPCSALIASLAQALEVGHDTTSLGLPPLSRDPSPSASHSGTRASGTRFGRYVVLEVVGMGAMGVVYAAYDPQLDRKVALKLVRGTSDPGDGTSDSRTAYRDRLLREARAMARIAHPNVAAVYEAGTIDGAVYLAMELVDGGTLRQWLDGKPSRREVMAALVDAGRGLLVAHEAGLVHRDFKPDNVLVGRDGRVRVVDFGIARAVEDERRARTPTSDSGRDLALTRTGTALGTPAYMSPEQHHGEPADARSDQFAFAVTVYEALYGERPFEGRTIVELVDRIEQGQVRPARPEARVPARIRRALLRALSCDPAQRHPSLRELLQQLERDPLHRARRLLPGLAAAALAAASLAALWQYTRPGEVTVVVSSGGRGVVPTEVEVGEAILAVEGSRATGSVPAGRHPVIVRAPDHDDAYGVVEVARGGTHELAIELRHHTAQLSLEVEPRHATITVDGVDHGARLRELEVPTGDHAIEVSAPGWHTRSQQLHAGRGEHWSEFVALPPAVVWETIRTGAAFGGGWLGDADGDGRDELMHRVGNELRVFDPWRGTERWAFTMGEAVPDYALWCRGDFDGDGVLDVLVSWHHLAHHLVQVLDGRELDGTGRPRVQWEWRRRVTIAPNGTLPWPSRPLPDPCPDLDGDGRAEVVIADADEPGVVRLHADGTPWWRTPLAATPTELAVPRGEPGPGRELLVVTTDGVHAVDLASGSVRWSSPLADEGEPSEIYARARTSARTHGYSLSGVARLDDDEHDDLLVQRVDASRETGVELRALSGRDGHVLWTIDGADGTPVGSPMHVRDVDGDGIDDVMVGTGIWPFESRYSAVVDGRDGRERWRLPGAAWRGLTTWPGDEPSLWSADVHVMTLHDASDGRVRHQLGREGVATIAFPTPIDWDDDGVRELAVSWTDGVITAHRADGSERGRALLPRPTQRVTAVGDHDRDGHEELVLDINGPLVLTAPRVRWTRSSTEGLRATPVVAQLDDDPAPEVVVYGTFGLANGLHVLDGRTGRLEMSDGPTMRMLMRPPRVIPDDDGEGDDLLFASFGDDLLVRHAGSSATVEARSEIPTTYASITLVDVEGDGRSEVLLAPWLGRDGVQLRGADLGSVRWRYSDHVGSWLAPLVVGEGEAALVVEIFHDGTMAALSLHDGRPRWTMALGTRVRGAIATAQLDDDPAPELVTIAAGTDEALDVVVVDSQRGEIEARFPARAGTWTTPVVVTIGSQPRIVVQDADNRTVALTIEGQELWSTRGRTPGPRGGGGPLVVTDLEHDGRPEILAALPDGALRAIDPEDGRILWTFWTRQGIEADPVAVDVDGDGRDEVLVAGLDGDLHCVTAP